MSSANDASIAAHKSGSNPPIVGSELVPCETPMPSSGPRVLGMGLHRDIAMNVCKTLRSGGFRADVFATDATEEQDAALVRVLKEKGPWDAVSLGGGVTMLHPAFPPTPEKVRTLNRLVDIIHCHAPEAVCVLLASPDGAIEKIKEMIEQRRRIQAFAAQKQ